MSGAPGNKATAYIHIKSRARSVSCLETKHYKYLTPSHEAYIRRTAHELNGYHPSSHPSDSFHENKVLKMRDMPRHRLQSYSLDA